MSMVAQRRSTMKRVSPTYVEITVFEPSFLGSQLEVQITESGIQYFDIDSLTGGKLIIYDPSVAATSGLV